MALSQADQSLNSNGILLDQFLPLNGASAAGWVRNAAVVVVASLLLTLSAKIAIPFYPVPLTLQTLVVMALGMVLGPRLGAAAVLAYLAQGALGLPVFAGTPEKGIGLAYMMGPTGGYLLGYVGAAFITGKLAQMRWDRSFALTVAAMILGNLVIYAFGLVWLGTVIGWDKPVLEYGLYPFVLGDLAKVLIVAALLPTLWKLFK